MFVIMGIVNASVDHLPRFPTKRGFTLGAPHLVASVNLVNTRRARGTGFRFFAQQFRRGHVIWLTYVVLFLDLETGRACIHAA